MRMILIATTLLGALASIPGQADEFPTSPVRGKTIELYAENSNVGESRDAFVVRIAPRAVRASQAARAAVCGDISGEGMYSIQFKTDGYSDECAIARSAKPYVMVNGTARDARENHFTQAMRRRVGYLVTPWVVKYQDPAGVRSVVSDVQH